MQCLTPLLTSAEGSSLAMLQNQLERDRKESNKYCIARPDMTPFCSRIRMINCIIVEISYTLFFYSEPASLLFQERDFAYT